MRVRVEQSIRPIVFLWGQPPRAPHSEVVGLIFLWRAILLLYCADASRMISDRAGTDLGVSMRLALLRGRRRH